MVKNKKQQFKEESRSKGINFVIAGLFLVFFVGIAIYMFSTGSPTADRERFTAGNFNIGTAYAYEQVTPMTFIENEVVGEDVIISLSDVLDAGLATTQVYVNNNYKDYMPLAAFINQSGKLVVTLGVCEPCRSESLRIDDEYIICESCRTVWRLDNLQGVNGGCKDYPPEAIYYEVIGDEIKIPAEQLSAWTPRPL